MIRVLLFGMCVMIGWTCLSFTPVTAKADAILEDALVADLSASEIQITSKFNGTELLLFGARNQQGDVVFVVRGPERTFSVSRKERVAGVWINRNAVRFRNVSGFYLAGASNPEAFRRHAALLHRLGVAPPLPPADGQRSALLPAHGAAYHAPLITSLNAEGAYLPHIERAEFYGDSLFKASLPFSKRLPQGTYTAEVYLLSPEGLDAVQTISFEVRKEGWDAVLSDLAERRPGLYGMISVLTALTAGWAGGRFFRSSS